VAHARAGSLGTFYGRTTFTRVDAGLGADPRNPYASPLYGDPAGLPPTLIQVDSDEILRDDATRMADHMRSAGCSVELEIWPRMPHVWHLFAPVLPEARRAIVRVGAFVAEHS
jgi:monoterpene epsilon-lactone hydrolase